MIKKETVKSFFAEIKKQLKAIKYTDMLFCIIISFVLTFAMESLGRHSVPLAFSFMIYHVGFFMSNFSIILCTVVFCLFFKRRYFAISLFSLLWLGLGVANAVILTYRNTPLAAVDFSIAKTALDIMNSYVKPIQIVSFSVMIVVAIIVIIMVLKFTPKVKPNYVTACVFFIASTIICAVAMRARNIQ